MARKKTEKRFALAADQIRQLVPSGLGACFASDHVVVDERPVGVMYREAPDDDVDSGWRFLGGGESDAELDDPDRSGIYDVNTIANYDPSIVRFLTYPEGTRLERVDGSLVVVEGPDEPPDMVLLPAAQAGPCTIGGAFEVELEGPLLRRIDHGDLVLWKPGLTAYLALHGADPERPPELRLTQYLASASPARFQERRAGTDGLFTASYRLDEPGEDGDQSVLHGAASTATAHLECAIYFDDETLGAEAQRIWQSLRAR